MSKLLLLKVKMRRIDIPVSEIGRHFQTFSVADEGLGGDDVFLCGSTLFIKSLFWKKKSRILRYIADRSVEELISPSQ